MAFIMTVLSTSHIPCRGIHVLSRLIEILNKHHSSPAHHFTLKQAYYYELLQARSQDL